MFRFTSADGRAGKGWSVWGAVVEALGWREARSVGEVRQIPWPPGAWKADVVRAEDGSVVGTVERLR